CRNAADSLQQFEVSLALPPALADLPVEPPELAEHDCTLQRVHSAADADRRMVIAALLAVDADLAHLLGQRVVAREERATVAVATERLAREEAGAADRRQVAALAPLVFGPEALRSILDHRQSVPVGDPVDLVHVRGLAIQGNRHDCPRSRRDMVL